MPLRAPRGGEDLARQAGLLPPGGSRNACRCCPISLGAPCPCLRASGFGCKFVPCLLFLMLEPGSATCHQEPALRAPSGGGGSCCTCPGGTSQAHTCPGSHSGRQKGRAPRRRPVPGSLSHDCSWGMLDRQTDSSPCHGDMLGWLWNRVPLVLPV